MCNPLKKDDNEKLGKVLPSYKDIRDFEINNLLNSGSSGFKQEVGEYIPEIKLSSQPLANELNSSREIERVEK